MKYFIGVDPGKSGAIVTIDEKGKIIEITEYTEDPEEMLAHFWWNKGHIHPFARVEKVHAMPMQGVVSMFTFGQAYGRMLGILDALQVPYELINPRKWQASLNIPPKNKQTENQPQFKKRLLVEAKRRFPKNSINLKTADAVLIAESARRELR